MKNSNNALKDAPRQLPLMLKIKLHFVEQSINVAG